MMTDEMFALKIYAMLAMSRQTVYALSSVLSLIGIAAFFLTIRELSRTIAFLRASRRAEARIIRFEARRNSDGVTKHRAVAAFKTHDGSDHEIRASVAHEPPAPAIGTTITVRYIPGDPRQAKIENFWEIWERTLFYFVIFFATLFFVAVLIIILITL
jgi:hypothetical protein